MKKIVTTLPPTDNARDKYRVEIKIIQDKFYVAIKIMRTAFKCEISEIKDTHDQNCKYKNGYHDQFVHCSISILKICIASYKKIAGIDGRATTTTTTVIPSNNNITQKS